MIIPWSALSQEALNGLMEEFITREGTDYGEMEVSLYDKVDDVLEQLKQGEVVIVFDPVMETTSLLTKAAAREFERSQQGESC